MISGLKDVRKVVTHANCPDGVASALLVHDALPEAEVVFVQYGTEQRRTLAAEPGLLFIDMTPEPSRNGEFVDAGAIVLDHHKGAADLVAAYGERGVFADEVLERGVSGAVLAMRHVWLPLKGGAVHSAAARRANDFAYLAGIRDTWQRTNSHWAASCAQAEALRFWPVEDLLGVVAPFGAHSPLDEMMKIGPVLVRKHAERVRRAVEEQSWRAEVRGKKLCVFEGVDLTSDAAEMLGDSVDLVVGFHYEVEKGAHKLVLSTRSHAGYDCAALAKYYGGGGHTAAAGFTRKFTPSEGEADPYFTIESLIAGYEARK